MPTDIEIARKANPKHIEDIAKKLGLNDKDIETYGSNKAKISSSVKNFSNLLSDLGLLISNMGSDSIINSSFRNEKNIPSF